jgi:SOS response regulatory protein OraA/RecX
MCIGVTRSMARLVLLSVSRIPWGLGNTQTCRVCTVSRYNGDVWKGRCQFSGFGLNTFQQSFFSAQTLREGLPLSGPRNHNVIRNGSGSYRSRLCIRVHSSASNLHNNSNNQEALCKASVLRMIGRRSHSRSELKRKLKERGYEDDCIERVLDRMEEVGLQDDSEYALIFARSKWRQSTWSPKKIEIELRRKGVEEDHIQQALDSVFGDDGGINMKEYLESADDYGVNGFVPEADLLRAAKRQFESYGSANISKEAKRRRLIGWLQRRGYSWDVIQGVMSSICM